MQEAPEPMDRFFRATLSNGKPAEQSQAATAGRARSGWLERRGQPVK